MNVVFHFITARKGVLSEVAYAKCQRGPLGPYVETELILETYTSLVTRKLSSGFVTS